MIFKQWGIYSGILPSWNNLDQQNAYPPITLKPPPPFGGGINPKDVTFSLSGEDYLLKIGSFSVGSPVSSSAVSKPIFDIKSTEDKTNISPHFLCIRQKRRILCFSGCKHLAKKQRWQVC